MSEFMSLSVLKSRSDEGISDNPEMQEQFLDAYDRLADKVFRRILFKTSNRDVAKDLTQDVFVRTWDYLAKGNTVEYINSFIYTVTSNIIKDWYKKKKSIPMGKMGDYDNTNIPDDMENITDKAEVKLVARKLEGVPEPYRETLRLRFIEGMSPGQIGEMMNERTNTVSVRIHRGLKKFREILTKDEEE